MKFNTEQVQQALGGLDTDDVKKVVDAHTLNKAHNYLKQLLTVEEITEVLFMDFDDEHPRDVADAIDHAFTWRDTSLGHEFWSDIYETLKRNR